MKIFHTADWHIGKSIMNKSFIPEQIEVLEGLIGKIEKEDPDVIIISGDIYDKPIPTIEAIELLNRTLKKIVINMGKKVIIISGNHDSSERLSFGSEILRENGLYIITDIKKYSEKIVIGDEYGSVNFYPIPYITPMRARGIFEEDIREYDDLGKYLIDNLDVNYEERNICLFHGYLVGGGEVIESDSERPLTIGGTEYINVNYFKQFDYVALGHLHGPQKIKEDKIRYSGSLSKYSFSESNQKKGIVSIEIMEKNSDIKIDFIEIYPKRDMKVINGTLEEILDMNPTDNEKENYIMIKVKTEGEIYGLRDKLGAVFPNILKIEVSRENKKEIKENRLKEIESSKPNDIFKSFYKEVTDIDLDEKREKILTNLIEKLGE